MYTLQKDYTTLTDRQKEHIKYTYNAIIKGNIIADIVSVSKSGMNRKIKFYYIRKNRIIRATDAIALLLNKGYKPINNEEGLKVSGCGMDMIMHALYNCLPYNKARKWSQNYKLL